jgi:NAD(P)-dependent dehydrogenase (short-subunit alcohol dehydrogenase family)
MLLSEKVVLVTGSTTGIGEAIARRCVKEGAKVMIHGLEEDLARNVAKSLPQAAVHWTIADLAVPTNCELLIRATIDHFGRLDALVNNAAMLTRSNIETTDAETFDRTMAVNLRAPLLLIRAAMPQFRKQGGGVVLNIGSMNALCGEPNQLAYASAKGGMMTLTRNLADAHGAEKIRFNQLNLGWTVTERELVRKKTEGLSEGWENKVPKAYAPSGRLWTPEQVAAHAVHWLSDEFAPVSGVVFELEQYPMIGRMGAYGF